MLALAILRESLPTITGRGGQILEGHGRVEHE
jgi:hypothetical protein